MKPGVLVLAFGGPTNDDALVPFLTNLFEDVLPGPALLKRFTAPMVARARARRVRENYRQIGWSPVIATSEAQTDGVRSRLHAAGHPVPVVAGMLFTPPTVADAVGRLRAAGVDRLVAIALFPQFSLATTGAAFDRVKGPAGNVPVAYVKSWYAEPGYVRALARTVRDAVDALPGEGPVHLLFSPHGLPVSFVERGDPYPDEVRATVELVKAELAWTGPSSIGWQSRLGPTKWLEPSTLAEVERVAGQGVKRLVIVPVSFVGEHIETLFELDVEVAAHARSHGIVHVGRARTVGTDPDFLDGVTAPVLRALERLGG